MPDQYQMTPVIRRIEASHRRESEIEGMIVTIGEGLFTKKSHYLVVAPRDGLGLARCYIDLAIEAPERKWALQLQVLLSVQFCSGGETKARTLVNAIHAADNPDRALQLAVRAWTDEFLKTRKFSNTQFIEQFFSLREDLKAHFISAASAIALVVKEIDIKVRGEDAVPDVIEIRLSHVPLLLQDYKPEVTLTVDADLKRLPGCIIPYLENNSERIIAPEIRRELRDEFRTQVTLHAFQFDVDERISNVTSNVVKRIAESHGRDISRLLPSRKVPIDNVQTTIEIKMPGEKFTQLDYPDPVRADVDLKLTLTDLGKMVESDIDSRQLNAWVINSVREAISQRLLGVNYVDLFPQFEQKLADTRSAVAESVESIGYHLSRFILQTNLDFHVLQRGFDCHIDNARFPLKLRECEVRLDIDTVLRITNRVELQRLFNQNTAITQTITETIRNAVARTLREVSPEEFYLHFYGTEGAKRISVAERLEDAIHKACEQFKPEGGIKAHITQRSDELSEVFRALVQSEVKFDRLRDTNTGLAVNLKASVNSISIDHWHQFQERKPKIEQVSDSIRAHVLSYLNEYARKNFTQLMNASLATVPRHAEQWVNERLGREYGLGVQIDDWLFHDETLGAPHMSWIERVTRLTNTLSALTTQLSNALEEGDQPKIVELKERIKEVEDMRDELYRQRGAKGSIFTAMDPKFQIEESIQKQLPSGDEDEVRRSGEGN